MSHTATYSPEDNKIRLYPGCRRLDDELGDEYASFKAAGFKWAAKQECFVCPRWTPSAEDWALRLCGEIGDEDYSPEERSADRAERFGGYRDKRAGEATGRADAFESGPSVFGHQNRQRAERQAARHDRHRLHAVSQWSKAEYWQQRTAGVISHALYRSSAPVRRSRLLRLESEQRKHLAGLADWEKRYDAWKVIADEPDAEKATAMARRLAGASSGWRDFPHPDNADRKASLLYLLDPSEYCQDRPITGHEAAALYLAGTSDPRDESASWHRWTRHYELRIGYEKAMLANEGGMAAEADIEPGGWICTGNRTGSVFSNVETGWKQVQAVNKSPATGRVVSVKVWGKSWSAIEERSGKLVLVSVNIERLPEGAYRAPTDEEREAFKAETKQRKAEAKASKPAAPSLVNPTEADAERLQGILNAIGEAKHSAKFSAEWERKHCPYVPTPVLRLTQAQYSAASKGTYTSFETRTIHNAGGVISRRSSNCWSREGTDYDNALGAAACKIRTRYPSHEGKQWYNPPHIVVITDKPQKALPVDWAALMDLTAVPAMA